MPTLQKYKNILIALVIGCVLYLGYVYLLPADLPALIGTSAEQGATVTADRDLLNLLADIKQIKLDTSIFQSSVFGSLQDFGQAIPSEPVGRPNPFAPLPGATAPAVKK